MPTRSHAPRPRLAVLQWGRVCLDAEGSGRGAPSYQSVGFNGAASVWTRKARFYAGCGLRIRLLQWGRVCLDAEGSTISRLSPETVQRASMGPRLFGRGRRPVGGSADRSLAGASMGPRLFGRGRAAYAARLVGALVGFNGAASVWTRKAGYDLILKVWGGNASMGPRLFGRGRSARSVPGRWQWRGFNGAASVWTRKVDAEAGNWRHNHGFNGAASVWTRKARLPGISSTRAFYSFNGAASVWTRKVHWTHSFIVSNCPASMGPRLFGRGRTVVTVSVYVSTPMLQWGRVCLDAEGTVEVVKRNHEQRLQWGRVCLDAEGEAGRTQ